MATMGSFSLSRSRYTRVTESVGICTLLCTTRPLMNSLNSGRFANSSSSVLGASHQFTGLPAASKYFCSLVGVVGGESIELSASVGALIRMTEEVLLAMWSGQVSGVDGRGRSYSR